jgi:hypothetical protein
MTIIAAFFAKSEKRSVEQEGIFDQIIAYLKPQAKWQADATKNMVNTAAALGVVETNFAKINNKLSVLQSVKGNYDVLPYDFGRDSGADRPENSEAGYSISTLFSRVLALNGKQMINGKTYQIQFSGDSSLRVDMGNGVVESGNPREGIICNVSDAGNVSYVYQSDTVVEVLEAFAGQAGDATVKLALLDTQYGTHKTDMSILLALPSLELPTINEPVTAIA